MRVSHIRKVSRIGLLYRVPHSEVLSRFLDIGFVDERVHSNRFFDREKESQKEATLTDVAVFAFGRRVETEQVISEMAEEGFSPADLTQGLCFAFQSSGHMAEGKPIAFPGSRLEDPSSGVSRGAIWSPFARGVPGSKSFVVRVWWADDEWGRNFEFLGVRE